MEINEKSSLDRATIRFFRVVGAAALSAAVIASADLANVLSATSSEGLLAATFLVSFLTALDKYVRDKKWEKKNTE